MTISLALKKGFRFMAFHIVTTTIPRQNGGESVGSALFVSDETNGNWEKHHQFAHNIFVRSLKGKKQSIRNSFSSVLQPFEMLYKSCVLFRFVKNHTEL